MTKRFVIPKINQTEFIRRLKNRPLENFSVVKTIENFFLEKRGYIFHMPKPGTPVILLISGGLDSTLTWCLLMKKYKLRVYPLFLHRGFKRWVKEKEAVCFFSDFFKKKYPKYFISPFEFSTHLPPPELEKLMFNINNYYHPARILENLDLKSGVAEIFSQWGLPFIYPFFGVSYASYLWDHENVKIQTIFNAVLPGDGTVVTSQTFTSLRSTLMSICVSTANYNWQFASFPFEKELGHWIEKAEYIRLGRKLGLPLEKTWSCYRAGRYQCGNRCLTCISRKEEFLKAGIHDKTLYENEQGYQRLFIKNLLFLKKIIKNII